MSLSRIVSLALSFSLASAALGCSTNERVAKVEKLTGTASSGATVYATKCASCHGPDGKSGSAKHNIVSEAKDETDDAIEQILEGGDGMPAFSSLSDQDIADVVAYLKTL